MGSCLGLIKAELRPASDDLDLVGYVGLQNLQQVHGQWHTIVEGNHVDAKRGLQRRVLEQVVQHHLGNCVATQLKNEASLTFG